MDLVMTINTNRAQILWQFMAKTLIHPMMDLARGALATNFAPSANSQQMFATGCRPGHRTHVGQISLAWHSLNYAGKFDTEMIRHVDPPRFRGSALLSSIFELGIGRSKGETLWKHKETVTGLKLRNKLEQRRQFDSNDSGQERRLEDAWSSIFQIIRMSQGFPRKIWLNLNDECKNLALRLFRKLMVAISVGTEKLDRRAIRA